jgi:hypothetical protein
MILIANTDDDIVCDPVWPNVGEEISYYHSLLTPINEMTTEMVAFLSNDWEFRNAVKVLAQDASPVDTIRRSLDKFAERWTGKWTSMEDRIASKFASGAWTATDNGVRASFAKAGFTLKFNPTKPMLLAYNTRIQTNINLIRSIPQQYLKDVSQKVWDVVTTTGDLNRLTQDIQAVGGVAQRRAALIARDQNSKAKADFEKTRRYEVGITEAEWQHSAAGVEPRPTHLKAGQQRTIFNVIVGWFDPAINRHTWPGYEINCRCSSRARIPGLRRRKHYQDPEALRAQLAE